MKSSETNTVIHTQSLTMNVNAHPAPGSKRIVLYDGYDDKPSLFVLKNSITKYKMTVHMTV